MRRTVGIIETLRLLKEKAHHQRIDPRVYLWANRAAKKWAESLGKPNLTPREMGQALLEEFNKFHEMEMDADDAAVAYAAAAMSQGLDVVFVGESHTPSESITHVTVEVKDGDKWYRFDPMYGKGPDDIVSVPTHVVRLPE